MSINYKTYGKQSYQSDLEEDQEHDPLTCSLKKDTSRFGTGSVLKKGYKSQDTSLIEQESSQIDPEIREQFILEKDRQDSIDRKRQSSKIVASTVFSNQFSKQLLSQPKESNELKISYRDENTPNTRF